MLYGVPGVDDHLTTFQRMDAKFHVPDEELDELELEGLYTEAWDQDVERKFQKLWEALLEAEKTENEEGLVRIAEEMDELRDQEMMKYREEHEEREEDYFAKQK